MKIKEFSEKLRLFEKVEKILHQYPNHEKDFIINEDCYDDYFYAQELVIEIDSKKYKKYINNTFKHEFSERDRDGIEVRFFSTIEISDDLKLVLECYVPLFNYKGSTFHQTNKSFDFSLLNSQTIDDIIDPLIDHDFPLKKLPEILQNAILFRKD